jgi:phenylpyruvate tautomerase PptA (4-oxalocrotonate tautomerase family)
MPILQVEIVGKPGAGSAGLARRIADAAARVLKAPPGRVWVRLRRLPRAQYAECGGPLPAEIKPVFVSLLKAEQGSQKARLKEAAALSAAIGEACGRGAADVHIFYEPPARGRAAFGGELLEKKRRPAGVK